EYGLRHVFLEYRQACMRRSRPGGRCDALLDHAVFKRMKTDHRQTPSRREYFQDCREGERELLELLIEVNPYSLKGASGRMLALFARTDDTGDELGKVERCTQRPGFAASNNRLCNLESKPFFAIFCYALL